ncbi:TPA: hypothetical protein PWK97_002872 [Legionella pneumophila]|nr:hypothetical protein [Legionella pneumophila]
MAHYLRDQQITNVSIGESEIEQITTLFIRQVNTLNGLIPKGDDGAKTPIFYFTIRFDGKGYRVFSQEELLAHFKQAKEVERIIFTLETGESIRTVRNIGVVIELKLDQNNPGNCSLVVTSDDQEMVNTVFFSFQEVLMNCKNKYGFVRTAWMELFVQIVGIAFGFIFSLWAAVKIAPRISIENSFVICFFFIFLLFSNTWSYLSKLIHGFLNYIFPNVYFYRPDKHRMTWLMQIIVTAIIGAISLWILGALSSYFIGIISGFVVKN